MCFSAQASFIASGAIAAIAVATIRKAKLKQEIPLALLPLFFSIQQFIEGLQWMSDKTSLYSLVLGYAFLFFAFLFWPTFIPLSIFLVEKNPSRKKAIGVFLLIGIGVSATLLFFLIKNPLNIAITNQCLNYIIETPIPFGIVPYILATVGSCLTSSRRTLQWFGFVIFISLFASLKFYSATFGSIWCFFSAALSVIIYFYFRENKKIKTIKAQ